MVARVTSPVLVPPTLDVAVRLNAYDPTVKVPAMVTPVPFKVILAVLLESPSLAAYSTIFAPWLVLLVQLSVAVTTIAAPCAKWDDVS